MALAATFDWISNLIVSVTILTLSQKPRGFAWAVGVRRAATNNRSFPLENRHCLQTGRPLAV